jgi:hypothetical protein
MMKESQLNARWRGGKMIYILYSATGSYEDYRETAEYYFTNEHDAEKVLQKLLTFDRYLVDRSRHLDAWKAIRVHEAAYRKIGVSAYIDDGISWFVKPIECGNTLECLR